ncbi:BTAD domain-containing putative transcriptional regulator [Kutzneria sp. NPDC051319]|uniref:AfsR/SARP family transcriptional regulator n=1 Tax=Kutzneria sp. NPDC051319 TaxID=3155047 RepID=UPI003427B6FB
MRKGLRFELLGDVRARLDDIELDLGSPQQRLTLAVLLLQPGRGVSTDDLVDALWGDDQPRAARSAARNYVHRLRRALDETAIVNRGGRYVLQVDPKRSDVTRFRDHVNVAHQLRQADPAGAAAELRRALAEWTGPALAGARGASADDLREGLERERVDAVELLGDLAVELGEHAEAIDLLTEAARQEPFRERLHELLILALWRAGRPAEALVAYDRIRRLLADELGVDPGVRLRDRYEELLRADAERPEAGTRTKPAQLPIDLPVFVGRETELAEVASGSVTLVHGMPGVGKTAFAVHLCHQLSERYPDGQLYVNLRGFGPDETALSPDDALRVFLEALGVSPAHTPEDLEGRSALYRSLLAGKRYLVVLDNARDACQVMPLLPGDATSQAVVTSRNELLGLVTATGARTVCLDVLDEAGARELIARRIGGARVDDEPDAVAEIVALCGRLPLALAVVSARAATHQRFALSDLAVELRRCRGSLVGFTGPDPMADVRSVLSWSYHALSSSAKRMLRLLSLHPGTTVGLTAAASTAGASVDHTVTTLRELASASLVVEELPGRYSMHDLVHAYAAELREEADEEAVVRLRDHYLQTAYVADEFFVKAGERPPRPDTAPGVSVHPVISYEDAVAWFNDEHAALMALIEHAPAEWSWQAAWVMRHHLDWGGYWDDLAAVSRIAEQRGSPRGRAYGLRGLARVASQRGDQNEAVDLLDQALALFRQIQDNTSMAYTHRQLTGVLQLAHRDVESIGHAEAALELFREADGKAGAGGALVALAWALTRAGRLPEAIDVGMQALPLVEDSGDRYSTALAYLAIGRASHNLGRYDDAASYRRKGIEVYRAIVAVMRPAATVLLRSNIVLCQIHLSESCHAAGRFAEADSSLGEALGAFRGLVTEMQRAVGRHDAFDEDRSATLSRAIDELHTFVTDESGPGWYERARELMTATVRAAVAAGIVVQSLDNI